MYASNVNACATKAVGVKEEAVVALLGIVVQISVCVPHQVQKESRSLNGSLPELLESHQAHGHIECRRVMVELLPQNVVPHVVLSTKGLKKSLENINAGEEKTQDHGVSTFWVSFLQDIPGEL